MPHQTPMQVEDLEGSLITCPLCRSEEVELKTTKNGTLQVFCAVQRSPVFLNEPRRLDSELFPDDLSVGEEAEDQAELEQTGGSKEKEGPDQETAPWEPDPEGWCRWCGEPIMPSEVLENADGEMEADHDYDDCDAMPMRYAQSYVYDEMLDEPPSHDD